MAYGNPFMIQPATTMQGIAGLVDQFTENRKENQAKQKLEQIKAQAMEAFNSGNPRRIAEFMIQNPEVAKTMNIWESSQFLNERTLENARNARRKFLMNPTMENAKAIMGERNALLDKEGVAPEKRTESMGALEAFQADPEGYIKQVESEAAAFDWDWWTEFKETQELGFAGKADTVGAQEILEDGTIIQSTSKGPVVYNKFGEKVTGKQAAEAIATARAAEISNARLKEGQRRQAALLAEEELKPKVEAGVVSAKEAATASSQAFDRVEKIYQNIDNLREVVRLVEEEGANTGVIADRMPSFKAAAIKLDNLQGRLGLDVIGSTTFGALSEAELKFALSTALPQKLEGPALVDWAKKKIAAQEKLADYLEGAAIFLGVPGNTKADWIEYQKKRGLSYGAAAERTPPPGGGVPGEPEPSPPAQKYQEGQKATLPGGKKVIFRNGVWEDM